MIVYQSPHIRLVDQVPFISKLQGTGLIPQCDDTVICDGIPERQGVVCGDPGNFNIGAFLPDVACNVAPTCSITDIFVNGSSVTFDCALTDPSPQDCSEGGCLLLFNCGDLPGDPSCSEITAEVTCSGIEPVSCANNSPSPS